MTAAVASSQRDALLAVRAVLAGDRDGSYLILSTTPSMGGYLGNLTGLAATLATLHFGSEANAIEALDEIIEGASR